MNDMNRLMGLFSVSTVYEKEADLLEQAKRMLGCISKCKIVRYDASTTSGISDLLLCYKGTFVAIELKAEDGCSSQQQRDFIADVEECGGRGAVCYNLYQVLSAMGAFEDTKFKLKY